MPKSLLAAPTARATRSGWACGTHLGSQEMQGGLKNKLDAIKADQLVPVAAQVRREDSTEVLLGRTVRRAIVVRQVEMGDAQVEGSLDNGPLAVDRPVVSEVLPQSDRDRGQLEPAPPGSPVLHGVVAGSGRKVRHGPIMFFRARRRGDTVRGPC